MAEAFTSSIRLTQTITKGGCAAKLPAGSLRKILQKIQSTPPPELRVGFDTMDDAAAWDLGDGRYLIQTLDFFTPIVDDPYDFGAIAAANSISDVYAMGGTPVTALTILAFPTATLPLELLEPLMQGAHDKIGESGAVLAGGHSIDDDTLKLGFSVSGFAPKNRLWTNAGMQVGDTLILTKALGTGTITSALKNGKAPGDSVSAAVASMKTLNRVTDLLEGIDVHAATDITGFGLAGHALQMAKASRVCVNFDLAKLPALPGAMECLRAGFLNRAHRTNREYAHNAVIFSTNDVALQNLVFDPQTSGGLLISIPKAQSEKALQQLRSRFPSSSIVGEVVREHTADDLWTEFI